MVYNRQHLHVFGTDGFLWHRVCVWPIFSISLLPLLAARYWSWFTDHCLSRPELVGHRTWHWVITWSDYMRPLKSRTCLSPRVLTVSRCCVTERETSNELTLRELRQTIFVVRLVRACVVAVGRRRARAQRYYVIIVVFVIVTNPSSSSSVRGRPGRRDSYSRCVVVFLAEGRRERRVVLTDIAAYRSWVVLAVLALLAVPLAPLPLLLLCL